MIIKGLVKLSLIDYPKHLAAVVFTAGCNFSCPFCHNRDLVLSSRALPEISKEEVFSFLNKRRGILDGVCVSGGEPTLHADLATFLGEIKGMGYDTKLDTNGTNPKLLKELLKDKIVDYIAIDIKAPLDDRYSKFVNARSSNVADIKDSLTAVSSSGCHFELRTTVVPGFHTSELLKDMIEQVNAIIGVGQAQEVSWYIQSFRPGSCLEPAYNFIQPYKTDELQRLYSNLSQEALLVSLRQ